MKEHHKIMVDDKLSTEERISQIKRCILEWRKTIKQPFDDNLDVLRLERFEKTGNEYIYHYIIDRGVKSIK